MVLTRGRSRVRLADMPPEVIYAIVAAASPHEAAAAAALSATCGSMRRMVLGSCITIAQMRQFARSQQIAPLLRRLTGAKDHLVTPAVLAASQKIASKPLRQVDMHAGLQQMTLGNCGWDAIPWPELEQLQQLRNLTLP